MQDFGEVISGKFRSGNYPVFKTTRSWNVATIHNLDYQKYEQKLLVDS